MPLSVTFSEVDQIIDMSPMDDGEIAERWLQADEYFSIACDNDVLAQMITSGIQIKEHDDLCKRGLECLQPEVSQRRQEAINLIMTTVMMTQSSDPELVARIYSEATKECRELARSLGLEDAKAAKEVSKDLIKAVKKSNNRNRRTRNMKSLMRRTVRATVRAMRC